MDSEKDMPTNVGSNDRLGLVARLRQERRPTAWTRGVDTDYPTAWEPNLLAHEAAQEIERLTGLLGSTHADFLRECGDTDAVLRVLGFDPVNCRTDGGSLKLVMLLGAIEHRDVMTKRAARKAERERCAAICDTVAQNTTGPQRRCCAEDLARAIREDQP